MMRALRFLLPVAGLLAGLLAQGPAQAQFNPFGGPSKTKLSPSDFKVLEDATDRLFGRPVLKPGARESWKNPETGSTGSLIVKNEFHRRGLSCLAVRYQAMARGRPPNRTATLNWCKTPDGWKIA